MSTEKVVANCSASHLVFGSPPIPIHGDDKSHSVLHPASHVLINGNGMVITGDKDRDSELHRDIRIIASDRQIEKVNYYVTCQTLYCIKYMFDDKSNFYSKYRSISFSVGQLFTML